MKEISTQTISTGEIAVLKVYYEEESQGVNNGDANKNNDKKVAEQNGLNEMDRDE